MCSVRDEIVDKPVSCHKIGGSFLNKQSLGVDRFYFNLQKTVLVMGLTDFKIFYQKPIATYFSGETIHGQILINLSDAKKFRKIKIELVGEGRVHWEETRWDGRKHKKLYF